MRTIFLRLPVFGGGFVLLVLAVGCNTPVEPLAQLPPADPATPAALAAYPPPATAYIFTGYPTDLELPPTPTNIPNHTATPRPTLIPTNTPTITPTPTPLAMAASSYLAVWADKAPVGGPPLPEDPETIFWIADPTDVGSRQELFRVSEMIRYMKLSPDGRYIAFSTWNDWNIRYAAPGPLWLFDMHSRQPQQLLPDGSGLFSWSPDSAAIASIVGKGEGYSTAIELIKVDTGEKSLPVTAQETDSYPHLLIAGWSANGSELYYVKAAPAAYYENDYEVWRVSADGSNPTQLLPSGYRPLFEIGMESQTETIVIQSGFLGFFTSYYTLGQTESLASIEQYKATLSQQPIAGEWRDFSAIWSPNSPELIFTHTGNPLSYRDSQTIWKHHLLTETTAEIGTLQPAHDWKPLSISPDHQWLALHNQNNDANLSDYFLFHLATGKFAPVIPTNGHQYVFLGWVENPIP